MRWTEAGYTTVAHEKINQDEVQEDIEINGISRCYTRWVYHGEGDIDVQEDDDDTLAVGYEYMSWDGNNHAPLDDEGQAKDVILDDSERGLGFGYESIHVWHKEKRKLGKNLMIHMASDSGSIQFCTLDVADEFAIRDQENDLQYNLDVMHIEKNICENILFGRKSGNASSKPKACYKFLQFVSNVDALQQMKEDIYGWMYPIERRLGTFNAQHTSTSQPMVTLFL
ncbi:hypothetical protein ACJX0J_024498, partial [Zea mays]